MSTIILIANDSRPTCNLLKKIFSNPNYEIIEAHESDKAWELFLKKRPQLLILDQQMPGIGGNEICRRIRAQLEASWVPIIMTSENEDFDSFRSAFEAGCDDFCPEPIVKDRFRCRAEALLRVAEGTRKLSNHYIKSVLTALLTTLNHEINNPLSTILNSAQLLDNFFKKNKANIVALDNGRTNINRADTIQKEALRIQEIIRNLRNLSDFSTEEYIGKDEMIKINKPDETTI